MMRRSVGGRADERVAAVGQTTEGVDVDGPETCAGQGCACTCDQRVRSGGIGINLAIQDAVAAANTLALPLARGEDVDPLLGKVQERRMYPTRVIQGAQKFAQERVIGRLLRPGEPIRKAPLIIRLLDRYPLLRRIPGRFIGLGVRRERVRSPAAPPPSPLRGS